MIIWKFPFFKRRKSEGKTSPEQLIAAFKLKYENFKLLLESNSELLKIITDIEQKLQGKSAFGLPYIEAQTLRAVFHASRMVQCLEHMTGRTCPGLRKALDDIQQAVRGEAAPGPRAPSRELILEYDKVDCTRVEAVGEKNANVAEARNRLGIATPRGFAITTAAFDRFMESNRLVEVVRRLKAKADIIETETVLQVSEQIELLIAESDVPGELADAIRRAYDALDAATPAAMRPLKVSLRSSAIGEDSTLSYAGQYLTVLNVPPEKILDEYKNILASLFSPRAIAYRLHMGIPFSDACMAVACMEMIPARSSGVMYTRNPVDLLENRIIINAVWGLGPYAVDGVVPPDRYVLSKDPEPLLLDSRVEEKTARLMARSDGTVAEEAVGAQERSLPCLTEAQCRQLALWGMQLEAHYGCPQDVEWALDADGRLVILQARPLRIEGLDDRLRVPAADLPEGVEVLLEGAEVACAGVGAGPAFQVRSESDLPAFPDGAVLVAVHPSPQYVMVMGKAQAIITDFGSLVSHMASLSREYMVPTLMNTRHATRLIPAGEVVTVDGFNGRVYRGRIEAVLACGLQQQGGIVARGPAYRALRRRADLMVPLNLTDPKSPEFAEGNCRTIHDIMRYIHETSYRVLFQLGDMVTDRAGISAHIKAPLPIDLYVIDLSGGLLADAARAGVATPEDVLSVPFRALLKGMLLEELRVRQPRPVNVRGFLSVMSRQMLSAPDLNERQFGERSYAIISYKYLNFSSRVGYHYSVLDSYCGKTAAKNYINFQFKGGAADDLRRSRRVRMIAKVLSEMGFLVETAGDRVSARLTKQEAPVIAEKLDMLGRLLIYTRQMDMMMDSEAHVDQLTACFLDGNYSLDPMCGNKAGDKKELSKGTG
jgi:pyruvate,water dikinase